MKFSARTSWTGSTGEGWENYDRTHTAACRTRTVYADDRRGEGRPAPGESELLLLAAASSCQMLWFLHLAAKARIDVVAYEDDCEAEMPDDRITRIVAAPADHDRAATSSEERVLKLCEQATGTATSRRA